MLASAGGVGRVRVAPGTCGSLIGLALGLVGARWLHGWAAGAVLTAAGFLSLAACTEAERASGRRDPSAIVLDEVYGMAVAVMSLPGVETSAWMLILAFLLFRLFDIWKPPPLRRLEQLPAGWGIMADDLGASGYTILVFWLAAWLAAKF